MSRKKAPKSESEKDTTVGSKGKPKNIPIPDEVRIKRVPRQEEEVITRSAAVRGDQRLMVLDIINNAPVEVIVLEGYNVDPQGSGTLVFVEGPVGNDFLTAERAKGKFAAKQDGTVIYNSRGFDEVSASADYDLVDVVKLAEHLAKSKKKK